MMRKIFLVVSGFLILYCLTAFPVLADGGTYYTVTIPSPITIPASGNLVNTASNASAALTVTVATDDSTMNKATVTVLGSNAGFLKRTGGSTLSSALSLSGSGFTTVTALTGVAQTLVDTTQGALGTVGIEKTWTKSTLVITQPAFTAVEAGTYSCTITFAATFTP
jgi:hypothetical protein